MMTLQIKLAYFSLVELIIVIAVLSLIASLLSPTLVAIAQKAETLNCTTRLKRTHLPYEMYLEDNNNYFIYFKDSYNVPTGDTYYRPRNFWRTHVLPLYMGADGAKNMSDPNFDNPNDTWGRKGGLMQKFNKSGYLSCPTTDNFSDRQIGKFYAWEMEDSGTFSINDTINSRPLNRNDIVKPSKMFFITDAASWGYPSEPGGWISVCTQSPYYNTYNLLHESSLNKSSFYIYNSARQCGYYLDGKANNLFVDGHIELMDSYDLTFGYDGSPHYDYKGHSTVPHSGPHESGRGFGDRNDRTVEAIDFWFGGR